MQSEGIDHCRAARRTGRTRGVGHALWPVLLTLLVLLALPALLAADPGPAAPSPASAPSADPSGDRHSARWEKVLDLSPVAQVFAIIGETLISEDLTCVTVGTLINEHKIPWLRGGAACFLGIYIGDLTFFFLGRVAGGRLLKYRFFSRAIGEQRLREFGQWFDRKPWAAIMACRFLPGIRVPLYVSVGAMTHRTKAFFWWTCFFACIWTPGLIGLVVLLGGAITKPLHYVFGEGWWTIPLTIFVIFALVKAVIQVSTAEGRQKIKGWFTRSSRPREEGKKESPSHPPAEPERG